MVREDIVTSAVSFLQDPSVAAAPLEQRIAFLRSKNLTQEEIDVSLARVGSEPIPTSTNAPQQYSPPQQYRQQPPAPYNGYQNGYWQQPPPPPPELPRRDWRDWFIMATVMGGVGYGCYFVAKRYIYPLIAPPTPPQIEQDKQAADESFEKAFGLIDQLAKDTEELKSAEKDRTLKLDEALAQVEGVIARMKEAAQRRDDENNRTRDELRSLKDLIPRAMETQKETTDNRLKELSQEMKSLKALLNTRVNSGRPAPAATSYTPSAPAISNGTAPIPSPAPEKTSPAETPTETNGTNGVTQDGDAVKNLLGSSVPDRSTSSSPYDRYASRRAAIPAWQLAAKKNQEEKQNATAESGTVADASAGAA